MQPEDFLAVASLMRQELPAAEAVQRTSVNRLYYRAHHEAARFLDAPGGRTPAHMAVIHLLGRGSRLRAPCCWIHMTGAGRPITYWCSVVGRDHGRAVRAVS
jgi:hypothetical protein